MLEDNVYKNIIETLLKKQWMNPFSSFPKILRGRSIARILYWILSSLLKHSHDTHMWGMYLKEQYPWILSNQLFLDSHILNSFSKIIQEYILDNFSGIIAWMFCSRNFYMRVRKCRHAAPLSTGSNREMFRPLNIASIPSPSGILLWASKLSFLIFQFTMLTWERWLTQCGLFLDLCEYTALVSIVKIHT